MENEITKEYQKALQKETSQCFWEHFEGRKKFTEPIFLAVLSVILTLAGLLIVNGEVTMKEIWIAIIPTIGVPVIWAYIVHLQSKNKAHVKIYTSQANELDKYNWNHIKFDVEEYNILGLSGCGLKISNEKSISLDSISLLLIGVRKGQSWNIFEKDSREMFSFVNKRAELLETKDTDLPSGNNVLFAITKEEFGIPVIKLGINKFIPVSIDIEPLAIDVAVIAKSSLTNCELPSKLMRLNVFRDGKVTIRKDFSI